MKRFTGVLLASDYDNTLVYTRQCYLDGTAAPALSAANREALEYFLREGGLFTVASGRAVCGFVQIYPTIPSNLPTILYSGAGIYDFRSRRFYRCLTLNADVREQVERIARQFPRISFEFYNEGLDFYVAQANAYTSLHARILGREGIPLSSVAEAPGPHVKILLQGETEDLTQAAAMIQGNYQVVFSSDHLMEITEKRANKGDAVHYLAHRWGIRPEHVYCIGDEQNDLSMLTMAEEGFAPANASPVVQNAPGIHVMSHCQEDAVAEVIRYLDEKYR